MKKNGKRKEEKEMGGKPLKRLERSLTIDNLWLYILSLLNKENMHAYNIFKKMKEKYGISLGIVTPYVVLYKLEEEGFIEGYDSGRRRMYKITNKGREILNIGKEKIKEIVKRI